MSAVAVHHVVDGPEGAPVLVLATSLGSTLAMWEPQVPALARRFRVVRYDHRGHGGSPVPPAPYSIDDLGADLVALLDHLGVRRAHVCGLSLGGMVGMWLAIHAPERLERLVLCCTSARFGPPSMWQERIAAVRAGGSAAVAEAGIGRWLTEDFRAAHPDVAERLRAMIASIPAEGYVGGCAAIEHMDLLPRLGEIRAPTLVIAAAQDPSTPPREHAEPIAAGIPGARLEVLDPGAHLINVERPEDVTRLILDHLDGDRGMRVRREVLGDEHVNRATAGATPFSAPFQEFITRTAWGEVWARDGLDRRTRSCITLALLAALRCEDELAMHVRAALRNGLTPEEIREVLLHTAVYAGAPAANRAFAIAQRTLLEAGAIEGPQ